MNEAIKAAVAWWRDTLKNAKEDLQDWSSAGRASSRAIQPLLTDEQLDSFAAELALGLENVLVLAQPPKPDEIGLHVDYSPQGLLYAAARKGRIGNMYFPVQTHMHITQHHVDVVNGHGQARKVIWGAVESKTT